MKLDPTHEEAARALIRTRVAAGDMAGALDRLYKGLWTLLENEYDVEPSKKTQELIARIKLGQVAASTRARPPGPVSNAPPFPRPPEKRDPSSSSPVTYCRLRTSAQNLVLSISPFDVFGINSGVTTLCRAFAES